MVVTETIIQVHSFARRAWISTLPISYKTVFARHASYPQSDGGGMQE